MSEIILDPFIGKYALVPSFLIVFFGNLIRKNIAAWNLSPSQNTSAQSLKSAQLKKRIKRLEENGCLLLPSSYLSKAKAICEAYQNDSDDQSLHNMNPPMGATFIPLLLQAGMGILYNRLFPEMIIAQAPFYIPEAFRSISQGSLPISFLNASYIASFSWFFFLTFSMTCFMELLQYGNDRGLSWLKKRKMKQLNADEDANSMIEMTKSMFASFQPSILKNLEEQIKNPFYCLHEVEEFLLEASQNSK